ncbi:hypothetical protein ACFYUY_15610 [Kitasatospora sp. NPDC004745]
MLRTVIAKAAAVATLTVVALGTAVAAQAATAPPTTAVVAGDMIWG